VLITNTRKKELCRKLFSNLKILTLQSQYTILLLRFVYNSKDRYTWNLEIYGRNTRYGSGFHYTTSDIAIYHISSYYMGLKVFNSLPSSIQEKLQDIKEFKRLIKIFFTVMPLIHWMDILTTLKKKTLWRFLTYHTLCLSSNSYVSACLINIVMDQLLLC